MSILKQRLLRLAPATLLVLGLLTTLPFWNAKGDDAFITFRFVRNLVEHHELAFNLGEPLYGFTSPLWLAFLSAFYLIIREMYSAVWVASFFSLAAMIVALWFLSSRIIENERLRYLAVVATLVDPWFMRWAFSGQEITFKIAVAAFAIAVLGWLLRDREASARSAIPVGLLIGLGCLTRPEFLLFLPIASAFLVYQRRYRTLLTLTSAFLFLYGLWVIFCYWQFGSPLPHTILVKSAAWRPIPFAEKISTFLREVAPRFVEVVVLPALGLLGAAAYVLARYGAKRIHLRDPITTAIACLWIVCCILGYTFANVRTSSMYTLIYSPLIPLAGFALLDGTRFEEPRRAARLAWLSLLVVIGYSVGLLTFRLGSFSWIVSPQYGRGEDERHIRLAEWARDNLPQDARIATRELGVVGYFGKRYTIDLVGIATPRLLTGDEAATLRELRPTHFWLYDVGLPDYQGFVLQPIHDTPISRIGGAAADWHCVLYRVVESPGASPVRVASE